MVLSNGLIILNKLTMKHLKSVRAILNDPEITKYLSISYPVKASWIKEYIQDAMNKFKEKEKFTWSIFKTGIDELVGIITLKNIDYKNKVAKLGYSTGRRYWNNGYTLMAVKMALNYAFTTLDLNRIEVRVDHSDEKSEKLLKEVNGKCEGIMKEALFYKNEYRDIMLYAILKSDYLENGEIKVKKKKAG